MAKLGADIVVLPEMWNCPYSNASFPTYAEDLDSGASPSTEMLQNAARECGVIVVGGSVPERCGERLHNTCCVYDSDGTLVAKHRHVPHLKIFVMHMRISHSYCMWCAGTVNFIRRILASAHWPEDIKCAVPPLH